MFWSFLMQDGILKTLHFVNRCTVSHHLLTRPLQYRIFTELSTKFMPLMTKQNSSVSRININQYMDLRCYHLSIHKTV